MGVPHRAQDLDGAFARGGAALFGGESGTELAFHVADVAGAHQEVAGLDAKVQVAGGLLFEFEAEAFRFLLRGHPYELLEYADKYILAIRLGNCPNRHLPTNSSDEPYHAREHLWELVRKLFLNDVAQQNRWMLIHQHWFDHGKLKKLVTSLQSIQTSSEELSEKLRNEAEYFRRNAMRMRYPKFRRLHLFVGTGVMEAGCKTVVGSRFKQSGMFWTVRGVNAILALRCCYLNGCFEDYWDARRAA